MNTNHSWFTVPGAQSDSAHTTAAASWKRGVVIFGAARHSSSTKSYASTAGVVAAGRSSNTPPRANKMFPATATAWQNRDASMGRALCQRAVTRSAVYIEDGNGLPEALLWARRAADAVVETRSNHPSR